EEGKKVLAIEMDLEALAVEFMALHELRDQVWLARRGGEGRDEILMRAYVVDDRARLDDTRQAVDVDIDAVATLTLPLLHRTLQREQHFNFDEDTSDLGDPLANAVIGWSEGNWHWNLGTLVNIPIGPWTKASDTNLAFNHWGVDTTGAVT